VDRGRGVVGLDLIVNAARTQLRQAASHRTQQLGNPLYSLLESLIRRQRPKLRVAGSNPVSRSKRFRNSDKPRTPQHE
jgi:hypothetical protein